MVPMKNLATPYFMAPTVGAVSSHTPLVKQLPVWDLEVNTVFAFKISLKFLL